uniref:Uncharacterized protein n=1 Tax=Anguilla anguilla TaxID=7936 RepID=A0A0E9R5P2_ANGAN
MCSGMCWKHSVNLESLHKKHKGPGTELGL